LLSGQIDRSTLAVGQSVLVDIVNGSHVALHTLSQSTSQSTNGTSMRIESPSSTVINNALLADGSVPLTGNLPVTPGVTIDGYDISVLGQTIDNLQAADSVARTGHTVLTHASHLVTTLGPDDSQVLIRHGIFRDKETLMVSNTMGEVETMRVVGNPVATVDDRGALCYRYTVTRRTGMNPPGIVTGWAAATLVNGLTHKGFISVDARENSVAAPNLRFVMHTDIDAGTTEQIFRMGNLYGILGNNETDFGFATGRLNTGDRYFAYNYARNRLALRGADIAVSDDAGVEVFRVWGVAEDDHQTGDARLGHPAGGNIQTVGSDVNFYAGGQRVLSLTPFGTRFRGMIWSGDQPGPGVGIGKDDDQGLIAARNAAGVGQFVVRTGDINVHIHMGNPIELGGYAQFADGNFTTDGIIRARAFELLGGGSIGGGVVLTNAGRFVAGTGNDVAVIDGEDATWRIYAGNATPASAPFRVTQTGALVATSATISGAITATSGTIGGFTVNNTDGLYSGTGVTRVQMKAGSGFWAGATAIGDAPFRVTQAGALTATNATISGAVTATSGTIGGFTINSVAGLYAGVDATRVQMKPGVGFWAGATERANAPFSVTESGVLTATSGNILGSLYVGSVNPRLLLDGANKRIESTNFASGTSGFRIEGATGNAEFNNVTVRGAIMATVLQYGYVQATSGSIWVTRAAGKLRTTFTAPGSGSATLDIEDPAGMSHASAGALWSINDVVRIKEPLSGDWWATITNKTDMATYWRLTATTQSGSGTFAAGAAALNYGQAGEGVVRITADAANNPYISIATHSGSPWSSLTERARLGNLTGISGASGYGLWTDNGYFTGTVNASAGSIGGWTIQSTYLAKDTGTASTSAGMAPSDYPFYAGSTYANRATAPFRVTPAGALTATSGTIAGWTLASTYLAKDTGTNNTSSGMAPADYPFYAGSTYANRASAPFRVDPAGGLYATNGNVAGFVISYIEGLYSGSGVTRVQMKAGAGFWAGATAIGDAPFRVTSAGALTATDVSITAGGGNATLNSNGLRFAYANTGTAYVSWYSGSTLKGYIGSFLDGGTNTMRINVQSSGTLDITGTAQTNITGAVKITGNLLHQGSSIGFFRPDTTVTSKQTVSGSRGGNAALASLLTALAAYGLVTDSTTA
jgi:hypothetical protein